METTIKKQKRPIWAYINRDAYVITLAAFVCIIAPVVVYFLEASPAIISLVDKGQTGFYALAGSILGIKFNNQRDEKEQKEKSEQANSDYFTGHGGIESV